MDIKIKKVKPEAIIPTYATEGSVGFDLYATEDVVIKPQETKIISTGLVFECPPGVGIMIYPRSGISAKTTLRVANGVGVIDNDYRGEVGVIMFNCAAPSKHQVFQYRITDGSLQDKYDLGCIEEGTVVIRKGDRIAQGVLQDIAIAEFKETKTTADTKRGKGGFGSSGK